MRRVSLIDSVTHQKLGAPSTGAFLSLVADIDAATRIEDVPMAPEPFDGDEGFRLDFRVDNQTILRTAPVLPAKASRDDWPRSHRIRFEQIIRNGEVVI